MNISFRQFKEEDKEDVLKMMRVFYDSPAVFVTSSNEVLEKDFDDCISDDVTLLKGYVVEQSVNDEKTLNSSEKSKHIVGYFMTSLCYTTEYAGYVLYIEDIYLDEQARGQGICEKIFNFLKSQNPEVIRFKLEVEKENESAIKAYKKWGFNLSPYFEMTKEFDSETR